MQKKIFFPLIMLLTTTGFAQDFLQKGDIYAGLGLGIYSGKSESESKTGNVTVKDDPTKNTSFNIMPEVNYFIANNVSIGLAVGMNRSKRTSSSTQGNTKIEDTYKSNGPSLNLNARKYFNCSETFHTFIGFGFGWASGKGEDEEKVTMGNNSITTTVKNENKTVNLGLMAGFAYNITPRVMFIGNFAFLTYYMNTYKNNIKTNPDSHDQTKYSGFNFDLYSQYQPFNMGFLYLLNRPGA